MDMDIYMKRFRKDVRDALLFAGVRERHRVLDVGVGRFAVSARALVALKAKVTCLDPEEPGEGVLPRGTRFVAGDVRDSGLPDKEFDVVTCVAVLHELGEAEHGRALAEAMRLSHRLLIIEKTPAAEELSSQLQGAWRGAMSSVGLVEEVRPPLYWMRRVMELGPTRARCRFIRSSWREEPSHFQAKIENIRGYWAELGVPDAYMETLDTLVAEESVEIPPLFVIAADFF